MLNKSPPRIPLGTFTERFFSKVLDAYLLVSEPEQGLPEQAHDYFDGVRAALARDDRCEFRFGSKIGRHTKLVLYLAPSRKGSGQDVVIDTDPNTSDDESEVATSLRNDFWGEVSKLLT